MKVNERNNIIRRFANSTWGCNASVLRPSCLVLCYSSAEYACPVWIRFTHARKLNPALHVCCRIISGCLKPTNLDSVHLLADIAPPHIRRTVACRMERTRQTTDAIHQLFVPSPTRCWQIEDAEEFHADSHAARLVCEQQQTVALGRQPDRHVSLRQNGTAGGRVFAVWIWRELVLLASS